MKPNTPAKRLPSQQDPFRSRRVELAAAQHTSSPVCTLQVVPIERCEPPAEVVRSDPDRDRERAPSSSEVIHQTQQTIAVLTLDVERDLISVLTGPIGEAETYRDGSLRKEHEVAALLLQLTASDAYHLDRRLRLDRSDDPIVVAFRAVIVERRQRLRTVLDRHRRVLAARSANSRTAH